MTSASAPALNAPEVIDGSVSWAATLDILAALPPGTSREVPVPDGLEIGNFMARLRSNLYTNSRTQGIKFAVFAKDGIVWAKREASSRMLNQPYELKLPDQVSAGAPLMKSERPAPAPVVQDSTLAKLLLAKLPDFNPEWADSVKESWFQTYEEVARMLVFLSPNGRTIIQ